MIHEQLLYKDQAKLTKYKWIYGFSKYVDMC